MMNYEKILVCDAAGDGVSIHRNALSKQTLEKSDVSSW
jgi:hypothetical protein